MQSAPQVTWEHDGPPIVRMLGASVRRAIAHPGVAGRMGRLRGRVALRSTVGPQAATIEVERGSVHVTRGVAAGAELVQENLPEVLELKQKMFAELDRVAAPDTILASSTSTIVASRFTENLAGRHRCPVALHSGMDRADSSG